ncbi:MAG TPA: hypothetical protein VFA15_01220, partial [Nitrososphaera sp.]|nr:hypothetical protein [Nitrososphaera sp.]
KENVEYCRELSRLIELRHLEGIKGNFAVSESEYMASAVLDQTEPIAQVIYSNAGAMVDQHLYLFEMLWNKAVPAAQRIYEIDSGNATPVTRILRDEQEIAKRIRYTIDSSKWFNVCASFESMHLMRNVAFDSIKQALERQKHGKHAGVRRIGTISENDISIISEFLSLGVQVRHTQTTPLDFGVTDRECNFTVSARESKTNDRTSVLVSNERPYIDHFNALFEEVWGHGTDASERIKEIKEDAAPKKTEVVRRPAVTQKILLDLISNARQEILLLLPSKNAYHREERLGAIDLIRTAARERAVTVRIISPMEVVDLIGSADEAKGEGETGGAMGRASHKILLNRMEMMAELR